MNLLTRAGARRRTAAVAVAALAAGAGIGVTAAGSAPAYAASPGAITFDGGTGGWQGASGTSVSRVTSPTQSGAGALQLVNTKGASDLLAQSAPAGGNCITVTPGYRYTLTLYTRSAGTARVANSVLTFVDPAGAVKGIATGQGQYDSKDKWLAPMQTVGIAPDGATCLVAGVRFKAAAKGERHYIDSVTVAGKRGGAANLVGPFHTSGTKILDATGKSVTFRGFNRSGMEGTEDGPPTDLDISKAKAWGANFIRLPLGQQFWLPNSCHYDATYPSQVDAAVNLITSKGMAVLLDLHWHMIGNCSRVGQWPMAEYAPSMTFWKQVAARYKNNPLVAFDLYNEPHNLTDDQWRNGGQITWQGLTYQTAGMQQMYDAVRSTGATNLVFVTGNSWGNLWPKKTTPITGTNIVYAIHAYTCPHDPVPQCTNSAPYDPSQFFRFWTTAETQYPIMVTEFGYPSPYDGTYIRNVISYAEQHGWHWSVYVWGVTWGNFSLLASAGPGKPFEPRPSGMPALATFPGA